MSDKNEIDHILNVANILKNFSISKKITASELKKIKSRVTKSSKTAEEYSELLRREIINYTDEYIKKNKIPGLIFPKPKSGIKRFKLKGKKFKKLYEAAIRLGENLKETESLSKDQIIFFIVAMIGYLELTEQDFSDFNKKLNLSEDIEEDGYLSDYNKAADDADDADDDDDDGDDINLA